MNKITIQNTDILIVVDPQVGFAAGGNLPVPDGENIVELVNQLATRFPQAVISQDWHPANHKSFASQHDVEPFTMVKLNGQDQVAWPDHCVQGTQDAEFLPGLQVHNAFAIIRKGMNPEVDSYSTFYDNDHATSTGLTALLKAKGIKRCFFVGLARNYCVAFSALDAIRDGFESVIIEDATRAIPDDSNAPMTERLRDAGVQLITSLEIL